MNEIPRIDVYPVGLLADIKHRKVRYGLRNYLLHQIKKQNWRAVRNYFNGYLAEVAYTDLRHTRCGRGWPHYLTWADT